MKNIISLFLVLAAYTTSAQFNHIPTDSFTIEGKVKHAVTFSLADLDTFKTKALPDVIITDHMGKVKDTLTLLKGILLKDILNNVQIDAEPPKMLSAYYFVLVASDNYKIVFSWNELFNTETGNNVYTITEEGKKMQDTDDRISIVALTDIRTGRRHMSNIQKIIVARAE